MSDDKEVKKTEEKKEGAVKPEIKVEAPAFAKAAGNPRLVKAVVALPRSSRLLAINSPGFATH